MNSDINSPLVSILIPTYNQTIFLKKTLISALEQDYPNFEIVICDDSTTTDVRLLVEQYQTKYKNIKYYHNGGPLGGRGVINFQKCFEVCSGDYISYLCHDDIYMPNKVSVMINYLLNDDNIKLVTSYRKIIDLVDRVRPDLPITQPFYNETKRVSGKEIGKYILKNLANVIGEPTTTLFRKVDIEGKIIDYMGYEMGCLIDVGVWLKLLASGDLIYIREPLSCFRIHPGQNSWNRDLAVRGMIDWYKLITLSYNEQLFISDEDYKAAICSWVGSIRLSFPQAVIAFLENKDLYTELMGYYNEAIESINKG
ncbi:glycosyltransferase [Sporomusa malonica]|uniref:Glycosyl transferase family 2 n=1 Tax=Sporomusa malonica TaxID=112901 RepID=A0A1W2EWG1_9FIRM|nr:glycosyltransferase [Sporomusa malonica]SMD13538.1 Glycosyl transferase family 2 [Sporomusa malonica]